MLNDIRGIEIEVGDIVAYSVGAGRSSSRLYYGKVTEIVSDDEKSPLIRIDVENASSWYYNEPKSITKKSTRDTWKMVVLQKNQISENDE